MRSRRLPNGSGRGGVGAARATSTPLARAAGTARARGGPPASQRFLAGEWGHGGVEETALQEAGYSKQEAEEAYFGNWLRDFSQTRTRTRQRIRIRSR